MEFSFDINQLFPERVSILDQNLVVESRKTAGRPDLLASFATVIDALGVASAKAQQLTAPITSASKLQFQKHQLYLLKEEKSNGGHGVVVGFLKVGYKKLFLLDRQGVHIEAEPLCVLDFYISEHFQRHGYGLELFDFMLQHKNLEPVLMAYDRPSPKLLSFLSKHYSLTQSVPQVNNFVVFEGFFLNRTAVKKVPLKKQHGEIKPYSLTDREVVHQEQRARPWPFASPDSPQRAVSSQCFHSLSTGSPARRTPPHVTPASDPGSNREQNAQSPRIEHCRARRTSQHDLVARRSLYSRHLDSTAVGLLDRHLPVTFQSSSPVFPPLPSSKNDICTKTILNSSRDRFSSTDGQSSGADGLQCSTGHMSFKQRNLLEDNDRGHEDWSWTIGRNCCTAQWVKQKHNSRTTRPW